MSVATIATVPATVEAPKTEPAKVKKVTKALRNVKVGTAKAKALKVDDRTVTVTQTSSAIRVDHSTCSHATKGNEGKKARAACRNAIEKAYAAKK